MNTSPTLTVHLSETVIEVPEHEAEHLRRQYDRQRYEWINSGLKLPEHLTTFKNYVQRIISIAVFGNPTHEDHR